MSFTKDVDEKIVNACNDLIKEQRNSARLRAEQETEYRKWLQLLNEAQKAWEEKSKIYKKKSINVSLHQEQVSSIFEKEEPISPFLLSRLSSLCFHIHLMTILETHVQSIHEEYRQIVIWIHEYWEEMERESREMKEKKHNAFMELEKANRQHTEKLIQAKKTKEERKRDILKKILSGRVVKNLSEEMMQENSVVEESMMEELSLHDNEQ